MSEIYIGRVTVSRDGDDITLTGQVTGGGTNGPGRISRTTGYHKSASVSCSSDDRSGSKRSGSCTWELKPDGLYVLAGIALNSSRSGTAYLSTFDGDIEQLDDDEFEAAQRERWPLGYQDALDAQAAAAKREAERVERDRQLAAQREVERAALAEMNAERAAEIAASGQRAEAGLPALTGTPKQIAYGLSIREAYARRNPTATPLKTATTAKYWIENHRSVLYR